MLQAPTNPSSWLSAGSGVGILRHTYGTLMAAAGAPLRTLQGWMGHRDFKTTEVYADFAPDPTQGAIWAQPAFGDGTDAAEARRAKT
jgi:integrase